ncbi:hypothetical protein NKJ74_21760, partial [Mesorhizobium sp. M0046]
LIRPDTVPDSKAIRRKPPRQRAAKIALTFKQSDQLAVPATVGKASSTMTAAMVSWRGGAVGCLDEALLLAMLDRAIA